MPANQPEKILNPASGRYVLASGRIGQALIATNAKCQKTPRVSSPSAKKTSKVVQKVPYASVRVIDLNQSDLKKWKENSKSITAIAVKHAKPSWKRGDIIVVKQLMNDADHHFGIDQAIWDGNKAHEVDYEFETVNTKQMAIGTATGSKFHAHYWSKSNPSLNKVWVSFQPNVMKEINAFIKKINAQKPAFDEAIVVNNNNVKWGIIYSNEFKTIPVQEAKEPERMLWKLGKKTNLSTSAYNTFKKEGIPSHHVLYLFGDWKYTNAFANQLTGSRSIESTGSVY